MEDLDEYWKAVWQLVCRRCIDSDEYGNCRLDHDMECALKMHFPTIVNTVRGIQSDSMEPYVAALRANVCSICRYEASDDSCKVRNEVNCALDRYYPLVVQAIEDVAAEQG